MRRPVRCTGPGIGEHGGGQHPPNAHVNTAPIVADDLGI